MNSSLLKIIGLFCQRALSKRRYSAKETYNCKEPSMNMHFDFATRCTTLHHTAPPCNTRQHTETRCNTGLDALNAIRHWARGKSVNPKLYNLALACVAKAASHRKGSLHDGQVQHIATHCYTLLHTATHCNALQYAKAYCNTLQHCSTLQHTVALAGATRSNMLQQHKHAATHFNKLLCIAMVCFLMSK